MNKINSRVIGILNQNERFGDWWESSEVEIPFFENQGMKITFMDFVPENDTEFIKEADDALREFLNKTKSDRLKISDLVYKNCMDFLNVIGYDDYFKILWEITDPNEIWNHVQPSEIFITRRAYKDKGIYIDINCGCDWEQEHGLQLVLKKGKQITRVSQIDGHLTDADAYGKPDSEDELLSKFTE